MQKIQENSFILIFALLIVGAAYLLAPILTPFLVGALLAYLANPLVNKLVAFRLPRLLSVIIVFVLFIAVILLLILLLIPLIGKQIDELMNFLPSLITWIQLTAAPWLKEHFGLDENLINMDAIKSMIVKNWANARLMVDWILKTTLHSGVVMIELTMNLLLIPVVAFYLLCDWNKFIKGLRNLLPRRIEPTVTKLLSECNEVLTAFFRGQLLVMLTLAAIYAIGLTLIGLKTGLLIGLIAGTLSIVPYLGFIVGILVASIAALMQIGGLFSVALVWIVFLVGHILDHFFLTPKLVGHRIGLHPVAVIFAILAGGHLFGFVGVLLALPAAAFIMVWVRYLHNRYRNSQFYRA